MPYPTRRRRIAYPFHRRSLSLLELPEHQVVFERIGAQGQVIAIGLEIEQDAGALIDSTGNSLEANANLATFEIRDILGDGVREIGVSLHPVQELGVALAV